MAEKSFRLAATEIKPRAKGYGYCYASDRITVDGWPVGYMYREPGDRSGDSGWRFFAGDESQDYADTAENFEIYDVNTIANYDPGIIPLLDAPAASAFARNAVTGAFEAVQFEEPGE